MTDDEDVGFPSRQVRTGDVLYRFFTKHNEDGTRRTAWFFASPKTPGSGGRFDLDVPEGTCYLSDRKYGAFLEVFSSSCFVDRADLDRRLLLSATRSGPDIHLADFTAAGARGRDITLEESTSTERAETQAWAALVLASGFAGVAAWIRHDPAATSRNFALFGRSGPAVRRGGWRTVRDDPTGHADLLDDLARYGVRVIEVPTDMPISSP